MNAGAYGSDWRAVMIDAVVVGRRRHPDGHAGRARPLATAIRTSSRARSSRRCASGSRRGRPRRSRPTVAELLARRKATQPTTKRTFGSVFKNPPGAPGPARLIEESGLKGHRIGGAVISTRHANFIENAGGATSADAVALMAEARRRVRERFGVVLEHEVRFLGPLELPPL